jgi:hypothetical protein
VPSLAKLSEAYLSILQDLLKIVLGKRDMYALAERGCVPEE